MKALYCGIFLNSESSEKLINMQNVKLEKIVKNIHCTFKFMPTAEEEKEFSSLIGKDICMKIVGYGNDNENSGFSVEIPKELEKIYHGSNQPHITVSLGNNGRAVNTGNLVFRNVEHFNVYGKMGICYDSGVSI